MALSNGYSKSLDDLQPAVKVKWLTDLEAWKSTPEAKKYGIPYPTMTLRSEACQLALIAQGRESLQSVNAKRAKAGMYPIKAQENVKVSWIKPEKVKSAPHIKGIAIDFFLDSNADGKVDNKDWNEDDGFIAFGKFMASRGWIWGGNFKENKDLPHIQWGT